MSGRWGIEGFPEPASPGHWGGYDGLAGHDCIPGRWVPPWRACLVARSIDPDGIKHIRV